MAAADRCKQCSALLPGAPGQVRFCPMCGQAAPTEGTRAGSAWVEFLDQAWDFFASVKVALVIIFLIAAGASAGSLIEQESLYQDWRPPELYYPFRYGPFWGPLYMKLGLTHAYTSVWFLALIYMLVLSLIICSLQRLVPLHRALQRPTILKSPAFVRRQPILGEAPAPAGPDPLAPLAVRLKRQGFRVWREGDGLHADRGRLSRYGPYIIHIGLIVCAFAATLKAVPGWDITRDMWIENGQTVVLPGTGLALRNDRFTMITNPDGTPALYQTDAVLFEDGVEVVRHRIRVNQPLQYKGWEMYQASFRPEPGWVHLKVRDGRTGAPVGAGTLKVDLKNPDPVWDLGGGYQARVESYYPDAELNAETGEFINKSREIRNPLFLLKLYDASGAQVGAQALLVSVKPGIEPPLFANAPVVLEQERVELRWYTGIKAHKDRTVPYMFFGLGIVLLGMAVTFFVFHRQVWAVAENGSVLVGARTNKNRWGAELELRRVLAGLGGRLTRGYSADTANDPDAVMADEDGPDPADLTGRRVR